MHRKLVKRRHIYCAFVAKRLFKFSGKSNENKTRFMIVC